MLLLIWFLHFFIMKNFKPKNIKRTVWWMPAPITQLQQWSVFGQSCFIYFPLSLSPFCWPFIKHSLDIIYCHWACILSLVGGKKYIEVSSSRHFYIYFISKSLEKDSIKCNIFSGSDKLPLGVLLFLFFFLSNV